MSALTPQQKELQRSARSRVSRIRLGVVSYLETLALIAQAYQERDWETLGYDSWPEYVNGEYPAEKLGIPAEHRQKAMEELRLSGLSTRAIAPVVGLHPSNVARQVSRNATPEPVQGIDGKTYSPARSDLVEAITGAIEDAGQRAEDHRSVDAGEAANGVAAPAAAGAGGSRQGTASVPATNHRVPAPAEPGDEGAPANAPEVDEPVGDPAPSAGPESDTPPSGSGSPQDLPGYRGEESGPVQPGPDLTCPTCGQRMENT